MGLINAFDMPNRQSFVVQMVDDKKLLGNAIALNSSMVHAARMIGPPIAGFAIALFGEDICFLMNALSCLAVIVCLLRMHIAPQDHALQNKRFLASKKEGFEHNHARLKKSRYPLSEHLQINHAPKHASAFPTHSASWLP
jgi:MFS family permease